MSVLAVPCDLLRVSLVLTLTCHQSREANKARKARAVSGVYHLGPRQGRQAGEASKASNATVVSVIVPPAPFGSGDPIVGGEEGRQASRPAGRYLVGRLGNQASVQSTQSKQSRQNEGVSC